MPSIDVKVLAGVFSSEQKRQIIERLTDTMVEIEGEPLRPYTLVTIQELASGDFGLGGEAFATSDVKALQASASA